MVQAVSRKQAATTNEFPNRVRNVFGSESVNVAIGCHPFVLLLLLALSPFADPWFTVGMHTPLLLAVLALGDYRVTTVDEYAAPDGEPQFVVNDGRRDVTRPLDGRIVETRDLGDGRFAVVTQAETVAKTPSVIEQVMHWMLGVNRPDPSSLI